MRTPAVIAALIAGIVGAAIGGPAAHAAESVDCGLTHHRVFASGHVAFGDIGCERTGVETLVITTAASGEGRMSAGGRGGKTRSRKTRGGVGRAWNAAPRQGSHALFRVLIFRNAVRFPVRRERGWIDAGCDATRLQQNCQSQEKCQTKKTGPNLHFTIHALHHPRWLLGQSAA